MGMKRIPAKAVVMLISTLLVASILSVSPVNVYAEAPYDLAIVSATDIATESGWDYLVTYVATGEAVVAFSLSGSGGAKAFGGVSGDFWSYTGGVLKVTQTPKYGYDTHIGVSDMGGSYTTTGNSANVTPGNGAVVNFNNTYTGPSFQEASIENPPPSDMKFSIPPNKPMPVQAAWGANFDDSADGSYDLVVNKPMAILVNLTGIPYPARLFVEFEDSTYSSDVLTEDSVVSFYPIIPRELGTKSITCYYERYETNYDLDSTLVKVSDTAVLPLYFGYFDRSSSYGNVLPTAYNEMALNVINFINATYPVKEVRTNTNYVSVSGSARQSGYRGAKKDAINMVSQLKASSGLDTNAVGIAIEPEDYFTYHQFPAGVVGVSWGPAVKGVIVKDGWYVTGAHEVAHTVGTKGQYYPKEYYNIAGLKNTIVSGVSPQNAQWRTGYCFMDIAVDYQSTSATWVHGSTYKNLFTNFTQGLADPEILIANGIIYQNGTVEFGNAWYHVQQGIPDILEPGNFSLVFIDGETQIGEISFNPSFSMEIDPGGSIGENEVDLSLFGPVETDGAPFAFATAFPEGTDFIELVDKTDPEHPDWLATYNVDDIVFIESPTVQVTFATCGLSSDVGSATVLRIDGTDYTYSQLQSLSFNWIPGSLHSVTVFSPLTGAAGQYIFTGWTNGDGLTSGTSTYTVPDSDTTVTANYLPVPVNVIPEVAFGTVALLAAMSVAFLGYTAMSRLRKKTSQKKK